MTDTGLVLLAVLCIATVTGVVMLWLLVVEARELRKVLYVFLQAGNGELRDLKEVLLQLLVAHTQRDRSIEALADHVMSLQRSTTERDRRIEALTDLVLRWVKADVTDPVQPQVPPHTRTEPLSAQPRQAPQTSLGARGWDQGSGIEAKEDHRPTQWPDSRPAFTPLETFLVRWNEVKPTRNWVRDLAEVFGEFSFHQVEIQTPYYAVRWPSSVNAQGHDLLILPDMNSALDSLRDLFEVPEEVERRAPERLLAPATMLSTEFRAGKTTELITMGLVKGRLR